MYRLLSPKLAALSKIQGLSCTLQQTNVDSKFSALLGCKSCSRYQSTIINPSLVTKKRKRAKCNKKYYDLLVVTNHSTKQKKTTIQKLTSNDLKLLATTNLNLSELYKLKELTQRNKYTNEHTYNNLSVIENIPLVVERDILEVDDSKEITCDIPLKPVEQPSFEEVEVTIEDEFEELEEDFDIGQDTTKTTSEKAKYEVAFKTLASYLEICSNLKNPQRGLSALIFHNVRVSRYNDKHFVSMKNILIYNALLRGFASKPDENKLEEIVNLIRKENVKMNVQSYAAILACYGRINDTRFIDKIKSYTREALSQHINYDRIMNEANFLNDEREAVLKAIKMVHPNFVPNYLKPTLHYNNRLVNHLNSDKQLSEPDFNYTDNGGLFKQEQLEKRIKQQTELETQGYITIKSIETKRNVSEDVSKHRQTFAEHLKNWEESALKAFNRDLATLAAQRTPLNYEPYMRSIPAKDFVQIIVDEAKKISEGSETYSPTVNQLYRDLGNKVFARYKVLLKKKTGVLDKVLKIHEKYCNIYASNSEELQDLPLKENTLNSRQLWQWAEYTLKDKGATLLLDEKDWNPSLLQTIGKFLYHIVMHDLKVDVNALRPNSKHKNYLPAFYTIFRTQARMVKEEVKPHPVLSRLYRASMPETLTFPSYELPMLCPPVPWTSIHNGGYLISPCSVVRLPPQAASQKHRLAKADPQQLYPSLDALNQLAAVPWKVNVDLLDVILKVFNSGGSDKLNVPEPPSSLQPPLIPTPDMDKQTKYKLFRQKLQYRRKKAEMYSLWCDCLYRLSLANHFRNEIFWLPHNMDFRGRVYPVPPHLNHLGSDLARSMLVFAESRPLGPNGLDWLKLHLINLTGLKKRDSIYDRLVYANDIMDLIMDSADHPLDGKKWWTESEEPWQTLACCMEIAKAVRSGNPELYRSHFPVHQDGSCNGLQHYAALGRDSAGAYSVNLCPSEVPQDVYSAVVALVEEQRQRDAAAGVEIAKHLEGFVKRKVIKQTIMTTVYGVTRYGARLQIARQLKDIDTFPKDLVWAASTYLTGRTFDSLRSMFTSTKEIQDWFTECARLISAVGGQQVEWVTPMGLPIVQPYFRFKALGTNMVYQPFHMDTYEKPNVMKQKNAFPPNFIHSLDSTHMMLTSLHCERAAISFVSVHDCYWTHASTVHIMNRICREQFVALHSEPILENLSLFLSKKYSYNENEFADDGSVVELTKKKLNRVLVQLPKTGDLDISQVLQSVYFFS